MKNHKRLPLTVLFLFAVLFPSSPSGALDLQENFSVRGAAEFARQLLGEENEDNLTRAEEVLEAVLACQETREGANHRGNFLWESQSATIQDLNSVEFTLTHLIPLCRDHGDRLREDLHNRLLKGIHLGLQEIRNLDVALTYTNIASMDCCNSCLGGELLGDEAILQRGKERFQSFADLIIENGTIFEFNSPGYTKVTLRALHLLKKYTEDPSIQLLAQMIIDRLGLGIALRIHPDIGRLAGPYSRAYSRSLIYSTTPYSETLESWVNEGMVSPWVGKIAKQSRVPFQINESANKEWNIGLSTFIDQSYTLGVATREVSRQTNPIVVQIARPEDDLSGIICSRYLIDTPHEGIVEIFSASGGSMLFFDDGKFYGVQRGSRAIGVYAPRGAESTDSFAPSSLDRFSSAKAALVWLDSTNVGDIWIDREKVTSFPTDVEKEETVIVETGPTYVAIRPLIRKELGFESPTRILKGGDRLFFEMYNYLGPEKTFWEMDRGSRFYQGQPYCAFYLEVAERSDYPDYLAFLRAIEQTSFDQFVEPPTTSYRDEIQRILKLEASRNGETIGLEIDLMDWKLQRRWTELGDEEWPMLDSPFARQNSSGKIEAASACLTCNPHSALLTGDVDSEIWVVQYYGEPGPIHLEIPPGSIEIDRMGVGTILWEKGKVTIDTLELEREPRIRNGNLSRLNVVDLETSERDTR